MRKAAHALVRNRIVLGLLVVAFLLLPGLGASRPAVAQTDLYGGLPTEVKAVA